MRTTLEINFESFPADKLSEIQKTSSQVILDLEYDCALLNEIIRYASISEIPYSQYQEKLERSQKLLTQATNLLRRTSTITDRFMKYELKRVKAVLPTFYSPWLDPTAPTVKRLLRQEEIQ